MGLFDTFKKAAKGPDAVSSSEKKLPVPSVKPGDLDSREAVIRPTESHRGEKFLLFVGVPLAWFQTMQASILRLTPKWGIQLAENLQQATAALEKESYFAVISDGEIAGHLHPCAKVTGRGRVVRRRCFAVDGARAW